MTHRRSSRPFVLLLGALGIVWLSALGAHAQTTSPTTKDCADFSTQQDAQAFYDQHKSDTPNNPDPYALDTDGDGKACEGLPAAQGTTTPAPTAAATNPQTTIAEASNGQTLPQATINVASTTGFPSSGTIRVTTSAGVQSVSCTGTTPTSFTGCSGGTGTMTTGALVQGGALGNTGAETGVLALSAMSLLESGYGLTLASKRLGIRRRAIPLYLLRKFTKATKLGQGGVKVADDVYLVHRSVLEMPYIAPLPPIPEVDEDVSDVEVYAPVMTEDFDEDLDIDLDAISNLFEPTFETEPEVEELAVPNATDGQWPNVYAAIARTASLR